MDVVLSAAALPEAELPELLQQAAGAGFEAVELFRDRTEASVAHPEYSVRRLRETLQTAGMGIGAYEIRALTGRKADSDERNLAYNLRQLEWDIHLGRALGVGAVSLRGGPRTDEAREDLVQGINDLLERVGDITLLVGPRPGTPLQEAADFDAILPQLDERAQVLLDTGELLAADQDPTEVATAWKDRLGLVRLGGQVVDDLQDALGDFEGPVVIEAPPTAAAAIRERLTATVG
jgi:sugar phosphate isomerase/epimerase